MSWDVLYCALSFVIGVLAGFQGIHDRYRDDALSASATRWGVVYLFTRGLVPTLVFFGVYAYRTPETRLWLQALVCGAGAEAVFRSRFYWTQAQRDDGSVEEISLNLFGLLRWYQGFFLERIAASIAESRKDFVVRALPDDAPFMQIFDRARNNLDAWPWPNEEAKAVFESALGELRAEFDSIAATEADVAPSDPRFRLKLGYLILSKLGRGGVKTLLREPDPTAAPGDPQR